MVYFSHRERYLDNLPKHEEKVLQSKIPLWNFLYTDIITEPEFGFTYKRHLADLADILDITVSSIRYSNSSSFVENLERRVLAIKTGSWFILFSIIEWIYKVFKDAKASGRRNYENLNYVVELNKVFEKENISYKMLENGQITSISEEVERKEIEKVFDHHEKISNVKLHISKALGLLEKRPEPDYSNAIKEAISGVEALCALIVSSTGESQKNESLGRALQIIQDRSAININQHQLEAFRKIYRYTSDANGIRHAAMNDPNLGREDAIYMIVICSSFVNYLVAKADKAGISLEEVE